jgi:hypothetical protein
MHPFFNQASTLGEITCQYGRRPGCIYQREEDLLKAAISLGLVGQGEGVRS